MVTIAARGAKWLAVAFVVSLGANLFLGGLIAGRMFAGTPEPATAPPAAIATQPDRPFPQGAGPQGAGPMGGPLQRMYFALSPEHRPIFEQVMASHRRELAAANGAVREARLKIRDALLAEPFDRDAFLAATNGLIARSNEQQKAAVDAIIDAVTRLPPAARRELADAERPQPPQGGPPRRFGPRDGPPR